jgi:phage tail tube protein FII
MPSKVYNNVEDHRLLDNGTVCEDVTKVGLPTLEHPTDEIKASGMVMDIDMPNTTHLNASDFTIYHNNGVNCKMLANPGKHTIEFRTVRQKYDVPTGTIGHESVKYRVIGVHRSTEKGDIETGSPYGSTEKYSLLRYEEEVNGEITTLVDAMAGVLKFNGVDYNSEVQSMLA